MRGCGVHVLPQDAWRERLWSTCTPLGLKVLIACYLVTLIHRIHGKIFKTMNCTESGKKKQVFVCIACLIGVPFTNAVLKTGFLIAISSSSWSSSCGLFNHFWHLPFGFKCIFRFY
jgi:hypothetical protein